MARPFPKKFWSRALVVRIIRVLHREGIPLHSVVLGRRCDPQILALIRRTAGVSSTTGTSLMSAGMHFFGSWKKAVEGTLSIPLGRAPHPGMPMKWPKVRVIEAIRSIHNHGIPLGVTGFTSSHRVQIEGILRYELKIKGATAQSLISAAKNRFGTWRAAVEATGALLPRYHIYAARAPRSVKPQIDVGTVIEMIRALRLNNLPLRGIDLHCRRWDGYEAFFASKHMPPFSSRRLLRVGRRCFGNWGNALRAAGIHESLRARHVPWSPALIREAIRMLAAKFPSLHWVDLFRVSRREVRSLLRENFGRDRKMTRLLIDTRRHFGGWRKAVAASGLDPRIYLKPRRRKRASSLSTLVPHVVEVHWDNKGSATRTLHLSERSPDPEQEMLGREFDEMVDRFLRDGVAPHLRVFAGDLVEGILGDGLDLDHALASARSTNSQVTDVEAGDIVGALKTLLLG